MKKLTLAILVFQFLGCASDPSTNGSVPASQPRKVVESYPEKPVVKFEDNGDDTGFGDFALSIVAVSETDTAMVYKVLSTWETKNIGLLIEIPKKEGDKGFGHGIHLKRTGMESDNFVRFMASEYKLRADSVKHFADLTVDYVNMNSFARELGAKKYDTTLDEYKLFFQGPDTTDYAELYLNVDNRQKQIQFKEKDLEYRPTIIRLLQK